MNFKSITLGQVVNSWEIMKINCKKERGKSVNGMDSSLTQLGYLTTKTKTKPFSDFLPQSVHQCKKFPHASYFIWLRNLVEFILHGSLFYYYVASSATNHHKRSWKKLFTLRLRRRWWWWCHKKQSQAKLMMRLETTRTTWTAWTTQLEQQQSKRERGRDTWRTTHLVRRPTMRSGS